MHTQVPTSLAPALAALACFTHLDAQTTVTVPCVADNTLYEAVAGDLSNGAGIGVFVGCNGFAAVRRAVLRFDVANVVPANAVVLSAQLTLDVAQTTAFLPVPMTGHRVLQSWGEGTSVAPSGGGGGGPASIGDATWLHRFWNTSLWNTPGGDFVATPSFTAGMPASGPFTTSASRAAAADVQGWLAVPASNHGWLLRVADETLPGTAHRIHSRESTGPQPVLSVTYLLPGQNGTWGIGCPVGTGNLSAAWVGAPIGGTTVQIAKTQAPPLSVGADFFTLALDPLGLPLLPGCTVWLPLAEVIPGSAFLTDAAGAGATSFGIPLGFPGYLIACQAAVLDASPLGFSVSNAALTVLQ